MDKMMLQRRISDIEAVISSIQHLKTDLNALMVEVEARTQRIKTETELEALQAEGLLEAQRIKTELRFLMDLFSHLHNTTEISTSINY